MTTPNIEELIDRLRDPQTRGTTGEWFDRAVAAVLLQSQEERIAMLESLNELAVKQAETLVKQRDTLRAELAAIRAQAVGEPDGYVLVPVEPTAEMWEAVNKLDDEMAAGGYDGNITAPRCRH